MCINFVRNNFLLIMQVALNMTQTCLPNMDKLWYPPYSMSWGVGVEGDMIIPMFLFSLLFGMSLSYSSLQYNPSYYLRLLEEKISSVTCTYNRWLEICIFNVIFRNVFFFCKFFSHFIYCKSLVRLFWMKWIHLFG